jgi:hypothetical protein
MAQDDDIVTVVVGVEFEVVEVIFDAGEVDVEVDADVDVDAGVAEGAVVVS